MREEVGDGDGQHGRSRRWWSDLWAWDPRRVVLLLEQADAFWGYIWAIFPKAIFWPAYMVYEGFRALGA